MRTIINFNEFIKKGIVKIQNPDKIRAEFLINESIREYSLLFKKLERIEINEESSNDYIKSCYDILMEIIRANMFLKGYNASGIGAHEAEISFVKELGINENDIQFLDQLRYFRNGMLYYGTSLDKEYAEKVINFTKRIYLKLREITKI